MSNFYVIWGIKVYCDIVPNMADIYYKGHKLSFIKNLILVELVKKYVSQNLFKNHNENTSKYMYFSSYLRLDGNIQIGPIQNIFMIAMISQPSFKYVFYTLKLCK